jgi:hypothetical protein
MGRGGGTKATTAAEVAQASNDDLATLAAQRIGRVILRGRLSTHGVTPIYSFKPTMIKIPRYERVRAHGWPDPVYLFLLFISPFNFHFQHQNCTVPNKLKIGPVGTSKLVRIRLSPCMGTCSVPVLIVAGPISCTLHFGLAR